MPATLATTRLVRGSTREIAQPCATHTASGPTATPLTGCRNRILATTGDGTVDVEWTPSAGRVAVVAGGRRLPLVRRPATTNTATSAATPMTFTSTLRDRLAISTPAALSHSHKHGPGARPRPGADGGVSGDVDADRLDRRARVVRAGEHPSHLTAEVLADPFPGDPRSGAVGPGRLAVGPVGLRPDDHDSAWREPGGRIRAAGGEVGSVDHQQIRRDRGQSGYGASGPDGARALFGPPG